MIIFELIQTEPKHYFWLLQAICHFLSFRDHMCTVRLLSRFLRDEVHSKIDRLCPDRLLSYKMRPDFVPPNRNSKLITLPNRVHLLLHHFYPDYNQWIF